MGRLGGFETLPWPMQMGHIVAEITRARVWVERGDALQRREAVARAIELLGIFLSGNIPTGLRFELTRLTEVVAQFYDDFRVYDVTLLDLERYLLDLFLLWRR